MLIEAIEDCLPQTQCQLCGYKDCRAYANAIANGESLHLCQPGGEGTLTKLEQVCNKKTQLQPIAYKEHVVIIDENECIGCFKCIQACPVSAISGAPKKMHAVLTQDCTGCNLCIPVCPMDCIHQHEIASFKRSHFADAPLQQLYRYRKQRYAEKHNVRLKKTARPKQHIQNINKETQNNGRIAFQKLLIGKAITACKKKGDYEGVRKLQQQLELLSIA